MSIQESMVSASVATTPRRAARPRIWARGLLLLAVGAPLLLSPSTARSQASGTPQAAAIVEQLEVKLVIGGNETIKNNSTGKLALVGDSLRFTNDKGMVEVKASSIVDIFTNEDSRQDITGAAKVASMAIPYGGSRALSLFSHGVDILTLELTDAKGGYHGVIFVLQQGQGAPFKKQLIALGAKASVPLEEPPQANSQEKKQ